MKRLLLHITLLLINPFSFADWDDVYYCQMTNALEITLEGEQIKHKLEKLTFKLDKTKKAMVFGKQGFFQNIEMELRQNDSWPSIESWYADGYQAYGYFDKGKFLYVMTGAAGTSAISANCERF